MTDDGSVDPRGDDPEAGRDGSRPVEGGARVRRERRPSTGREGDTVGIFPDEGKEEEGQRRRRTTTTTTTTLH